MNVARTVGRLVGVVVLASGLGAAATTASARPGTQPTPATAGHLLYVSGTGAVDIVTVDVDGGTTPPNQVGPVSIPTGTEKVTVSNLVASGDGSWAAWAEAVTKPHHDQDVSDQLVVRDNDNGAMFMLKTADDPVGFAGHLLVASNGVGAFKVVLNPSPHLVSLHDGSRLLGTYRHGLIDDPATFPHHKPGVLYEDHVRLRSLSGHKRVLHVYRHGSQSLRSIELTTASGDSKHLLLELGDKTDFGGVGPSSVIDELSLTGSADRTRLGHYGTASAQWRAWTESYVGPDDHVWVTWYSADAQGVRSVVTRYVGGHWQLVASHAVTAVGNSTGYVVVQPGKFALVANSQANQHVPTPTGNAVLFHHGHVHALSIKGSSFVWISRNVELV